MAAERFTNSRSGSGKRTSLVKGESPLTLISNFKAPGAVASLEAIVYGAPKSRCSRRGYLYVASRSTGQAFELPCGRWDCPSCGRFKQVVAREVIGGGMDQRRSDGDRLRTMTITSPGTATVEYLREFSAAFDVLRTNLRKNHGLREWCGVIEFNAKDGAPHLHMVFSGDYIDHAKLKKAAVGRAGRLGEVVYIEDDHGGQVMSSYMTKEVGKLAGYLAKSQVDRRVVALKFHPLRKSRAWYPGGMAAAEAVVRARWIKDKPTIEADDWEVVRIDDHGRVRGIRRSKAAEVVPLAPVLPDHGHDPTAPVVAIAA